MSKVEMMRAKDKKKGPLMPRLRFPEFRGAGEWQESFLGECSAVVRGGSPRPIDNFLTADRDGLNWLKIGDIDKEAKYVVATTEKVRAEALSKTREISPGDLILSNSMSFGRPYISKIKTCIHDGWISVTKISKKLHVDYIYYLISSPFSQQYFTSNAAGSGVQNLNADIIKSLPIFFPSFLEQQRIADCLSSLDERITTEANRLDALKFHKKGLLKQLFLADGETLPALRFPEFRDAGKWKKADFGTIAKFLSGGTPSKDISDYWGGDIPWISASSMHNTKIEKSDCNITKLAVSNGARIAQKGTLLLLVRGSMLHKRILLGISEVDVSFNQDVKALVLSADITEVYLMYFLMASEAKLLAAVVQTGIGAGKLDTEDLNNFPIMMPSLSEQKRISDCFSSLDELITAQAQKIDLLKTYKKGLIQQLFPVVDEAQA